MGAQKQSWFHANYHDICVCGALQIHFLQPFSNAQACIRDASILRFLRREAYKLYVVQLQIWTIEKVFLIPVSKRTVTATAALLKRLPVTLAC